MKKSTFLQVSDLVSIALCTDNDQHLVIRIISKLYRLANLSKTFRLLAASNKLHYVFTVLERLKRKHKLRSLTDIIVTAFNEAVHAKQYIIAFKLYKSYDYFLNVEWSQVMPTLLEALKNDNFFYETKLQLVAKFIDFIDYYTTGELLTIFEQKNDARVNSQNLRESLPLVNMNPFMVQMLIYRFTQRIVDRTPGLSCRVKKLQ